jgi:hypothetical protein
LDALPASHRQCRKEAATGGQRHTETVSQTGYAERRHELCDGYAAGDQRQRRSDPCQERPLVGQREAVVRLLLAGAHRNRSFGAPIIGQRTPRALFATP